MEFAKQVTDAIYWMVSMSIIKPLEEEVCIEVGCSRRMSIKNMKASSRHLKCNVVMLGEAILLTPSLMG
jgi:hypothetical protein